MAPSFRKLSRVIAMPFNKHRAFKRLKDYHARTRTLEEAVEFAINFGGHGAFKVKTLQIRQEILALARAVEGLNPETILEIGTARGGTLLIWSKLASQKVISCDLEDMEVQAPLLKAFPPPGSRCRVSLLSGNSHEQAFKQRVSEELAGKTVDFLFIDGDHTEAGVGADYRDYREFVRPGGIIAFHDIVKKQILPTNQVHQFWEKIRQNAVTEEFIHDENQVGYGIGIIRV